MFKNSERLYFIDLFDGKIKSGKFLENDNDGIWIKLDGQSTNTYLFSNDIPVQVFKQLDKAEDGLANIKKSMKDKLLKNYFFINDLYDKLKDIKGDLYAGVIKEILIELKNGK